MKTVNDKNQQQKEHMRKMNCVRWMAAVVAIGMIGLTPARAAGIAVKDGQKIAFMGDSITEAGPAPEAM